MSTLKSIVAGLAVAATLIAPLSIAPANAGEREWRHKSWNGDRHWKGDRKWRGDRHWRGDRPWGGHPGYVVRRHHRDDALVAGVIGLAAGAIIAGALSDNQPRVIYRDAPEYYPPAPRARVVQVAPGYGSYEPWTRGWYQWCDARYKSFDPKRGTFRGYDGRDHFCVVK